MSMWRAYAAPVATTTVSAVFSAFKEGKKKPKGRLIRHFGLQIRSGDAVHLFMTGPDGRTAPYDAGFTGRLVAEFAVHELGKEAVLSLLEAGGETRKLADLRAGTEASTYSQLRCLMEAVSGGLGDPACLAESPLLITIDQAFAQMAEMVRGIGSPDALLEACETTMPMQSMFDWKPVRVGPRRWQVEIHSRPGMPAYRELCAFMTGLHRYIPTYFGQSAARVVEEQCECDGAPYCQWQVEWTDQLSAEEEKDSPYRVEVLEEHLRQFQLIVSDLISNETHESVMQRITQAAAGALNATAAVIVTVTGVPPRTQITAVGLTDEEAEFIGTKALAGEPLPEVFAVDIASSRASYGKLVLVGKVAGIIARSPDIAESYGRMAAAALDSAETLAEARRQAATAQALLELSRVLVELASVDDMAASVARAVPSLVDCDRSAVILCGFDEDGAPTGALRLAAAYGYPEQLVANFSNNILKEEDFLDADEDGLLWRSYTIAGSELAVGAPIVTPEGTIGWILAGVSSDGARLAKNAELSDRLRGLAAQAAGAISHARLVDRIRYRSMHDVLTGLPNRALLLDRLKQMLRRAQRARQPVAALFIDLDGFKEINDTLGHDSGDHVLRAVAERLGAVVRESDTVSRLGGDEFVVLVDAATLDASPELVAERVLEVLREPFVVPGAPVPLALTASIGIATAIDGDPANLLRDADIALYEAKDGGKNNFVTFQPEMQFALRDQQLLDMDLRLALSNGEMFLVYQPIFDLGSGRTTGVEALLRWRHPERGLVPPDKFVPLLEASGLIREVGAWVLEEACRQGAEWHRQGRLLEMSINVSARQLECEDFVDHVERALEASQFPAEALLIEITETALMRNITAVVPRLDAIKAYGVRVAIDDFGTGYSSLGYLRQLPVDILKIDQSFISAMGDSPEAGALIHTFVQLGKTLGLKTLAEGIEQPNQYSRLRQEDCDKGQGYLYAVPLPASEIIDFLTEHGNAQPTQAAVASRD